MLNHDDISTAVIPFPPRGDQLLFVEQHEALESEAAAEDGGFISLMRANGTCGFHVFVDDELECILRTKREQVCWSNIAQDFSLGEAL